MRCSALPLASKCRGSWKLTGGYGSVQSRLGQAFHEAARAKALNQPFDMDGLRTRYALTDEEVKGIEYGIYNITVRIPEGAWLVADDRQLSVFDGRLTGTPDLAIYFKRVLTIPDWKSGWGDVEDPQTNNQLIGYAILVIEAILQSGLEPPERVDLMVVQPKINQVKIASFTLGQIEERKKDILRVVEEAEAGEGQFTTGPWCTVCFKNMHCPAFAGQVKVLAEFIEPGIPVDVEKALKIMLPLAKACATVTRKVEELAKAWVDTNGPLELGGGQMYVKVIDEKKEVDARKAFEVLVGDYFNDEDVWPLMSISMKAITDLAVKTKRGLSTVVKNSLAEAGAVKTNLVVKYTIKKGGDINGRESGTGNDGTGRQKQLTGKADAV